MKTYLLYTIIFILLLSCDNPYKDDLLTIKRENYNGNELKINGYYYKGYNSRDFVFLYKNGVVFGLINFFDLPEIENYENNFKNGSYYKRYGNEKEQWGVFIINSKEIVIQKWWDSPEEFSYALEKKTLYGKILNDTSFVIYKTIYYDGYESPDDDVYHFKQLSPKPDSTNTFIY